MQAYDFYWRYLMQSSANVSPSNNHRPNKLHPALWLAAISVTAFSFAGIAHLTGWLPNQNKEPPAVVSTPPSALAMTSNTAPTVVAPTPSVTVNQTVSVPPAATNKPLETRITKTEPVAQRTSPAVSKPHKAATPAPVYVANNPTVYSPPPAPKTCYECGNIETIREIPVEGEGSGLGAVAGGLVGGVIGNQVGAGHGREWARVAGILGGAYAGHQLEKNQHKKITYEIVVRFEDGTSGVYKQEQAPAWRAGDRVKVNNGLIVANNHPHDKHYSDRY